MVLDIESIDESIELFDKELNDIKRQANDGYLKIKPNETVIFNLKFNLYFNYFSSFNRSTHVLHTLLQFVNK